MKDEERRGVYGKDLSALYQPYYQALCDLLPPHWQPYYGLRSVALQEALYSRGRTGVLPGKIVTNAKGGESAHNYGCATDWTVFNSGVPIWLKESDPEWNTYRDACEKAGLTWGGSFSSITDYYHNEVPISVSWKEVAQVLASQGMDEAMAFIKKVMF